MEKLTKEQIILETITYYSEDINRRGISEHGCVYLSNDGTMCAVGRCLENPKSYLNNVDGLNVLLDHTRSQNIDDLLKNQYKGHNTIFWDDLQRLHDGNHYWDSDGLSIKGEIQLEFLLKKYADKSA